MSIWIFLPKFLEDHEVEAYWESSVEIPNMPIRYFEDLTAFYFKSEEFDPSNKWQVRFFVFLAYPYIYCLSLFQSLLNNWTMPMFGMLYILVPDLFIAQEDVH